MAYEVVDGLGRGWRPTHIIAFLALISSHLSLSHIMDSVFGLLSIHSIRTRHVSYFTSHHGFFLRTYIFASVFHFISVFYGPRPFSMVPIRSRPHVPYSPAHRFPVRSRIVPPSTCASFPNPSAPSFTSTGILTFLLLLRSSLRVNTHHLGSPWLRTSSYVRTWPSSS
ncbi:hypothetical protein BD626DRAFT_48953 [Schizophyllum amplum]|uniref:Uncharacterized protein n=1 Tax=Schizophyllum amplum TaxID=97359 RepID=A0A550BSS9_9AGAR|nr:hypothetical protein BD626DRAFT_48953 [Auriculariopsis ampla]